MKHKGLIIKIGAALIGVIALTFFIPKRDPLPSLEERAYTEWLQNLEDTRKDRSKVAPLSLVLEGAIEGPFRWTLDATDRERFEKGLRILEVLWEVRPEKLFVDNEPTHTGSDFFLSASDGKRRFFVTFNRRDVEKSIQLQNLLKLFQLSQVPK